MDIRKVKKLIELLEESNIGEIEIKEGEESVRISRQGNQPAAPVAYAAPPAPAPAAAPAPVEAPAPEAAAPAPASRQRRAITDGGHLLSLAQSRGTFLYRGGPNGPRRRCAVYRRSDEDDEPDRSGSRRNGDGDSR